MDVNPTPTTEPPTEIHKFSIAGFTLCEIHWVYIEGKKHLTRCDAYGLPASELLLVYFSFVEGTMLGELFHARLLGGLLFTGLAILFIVYGRRRYGPRFLVPLLRGELKGQPKPPAGSL